LAFGLGTLPNLLAMGLAAERLGHWLRRPALRQVCGAGLVLYAAYCAIKLIFRP
jgi:hypothetical protein